MKYARERWKLVNSNLNPVIIFFTMKYSISNAKISFVPQQVNLVFQFILN